jgi:2-oxoglutarate dehydrogenase complex dehydrogenase (E1) component-like enzyme
MNKTARMLRAIANVFDVKELDDTIKNELLESVMDIMDTKKPETKKSRTRTTNTPKGEELKRLMMKPVTVTKTEELQRSLDVMKRVEENDKIRAYKTKIIKQDDKMKKILQELETMRLQVVTDLQKQAEELENKEVVNSES